MRLILINFQPTQFFNPRNSADGNNILLIASKADILKENVLKLNYEQQQQTQHNYVDLVKEQQYGNDIFEWGGWRIR